MPARRKKFLSFVISLCLLFSHRAIVRAAITFSVANPVTSNDETEVEVNLLGLTSSSCLDGRCYLQGTLTAQDQNQYFGQTGNNNGEWFDYQSSPAIDTIKSTFFAFEPQEGSWSGKLKIKNNSADSNYHGPGNYILKLRRYSGKSTSSAGESNSLTVSLTTVLPTPTPFSEPTPTSSPTPQSTSNNSSSSNNNDTKSPMPTVTETPIGKVAGITTTKKPKSASFPADLKLSLDSATDSASFGALLVTPSPEPVAPVGGSWPAYTIYSGVGVTGFAVAWILVRSYNKGLLWSWLKFPQY